MRKGLLIQFVLVFAALVCSFMLNIMLLSLAVENKDINYSHVVFSALFFFAGLICLNMLHGLRDQREAEEEEFIQHQLDMADDYASREL